jgi:sugar/nucleoside kinase (ribokinase family)
LNESTPPDFVIIGHITQDLQPDGRLSPGGTVSYAATTAHRLGYRVGVVTSTGPDLDVTQVLPFAEITCQPAAATTVFENIYLNGKRKQILHRRAAILDCKQIPSAWKRAPIVHLGPLDQEIDQGVFHCFDSQVLIGVTPQGFLRRWDEQGLVSFTEWTPPASVLRRIKVLVLSEMDVPDPDGLVREWGRWIDIIVVTRAARGASVYHSGGSCTYPARSTREVDPTGAGDVFAAAFLIRLMETGDPCQAAHFANVVASFSIEGPGVTSIPTRRQVEAYLDSVGADQYLIPELAAPAVTVPAARASLRLP